MTDLITFDIVVKHLPIFRFHPNETCFPCSIEFLLQGSTLRSKTDLPFAIPNPSFNTLHDHPDPQYFVDINPSQYHGMEHNRVISAPIYYAIQQVSDEEAPRLWGAPMPCIDIHYIVWYAQQDGQTMILHGADAFAGASLGLPMLGDFKNPTDPMPIVARTYGEHQGDQERVVVRLSLPTMNVIQVGYDAHGETQWCPLGQYPAEGDRPICYVALTGHSSHPVMDGQFLVAHNQEVFLKEDGTGPLEVGSVVSKAGPEWRPTDLRFLGINSATKEPIGNEVWVKFQGRFGHYEEHQLESATYWNGDNLASVDWAYANTINAGASVFGLLKDEYKHHDGTDVAPSNLWASGPRPVPPDGTLLQEATNAAIFVMRNGCLCWISSFSLWNQLGGQSKTQVVPNGSLVQLPLGPALLEEGILLHEPNHPEIYVIHNNQKCWISTEAILNQQYGGVTKVQSAPSGTMTIIPNGPSIFAEGAVVKGNPSGRVYVMNNNQKCVAADRILQLRYNDGANALQVADAVLALSPDGPAIH